MKKKNIICGVGGLCALVLIIGLIFYLSEKKETDDEKEVKIPTIEFTENEAIIEFVIGSENRFTGEVKNKSLLKNAFVLKKEIKKEDLKKKAEKLSFEDEDIVNEGENFTLYSKDNRSLTIYSDGTFNYQVNKSASKKEIEISDEDCKKIAMEAIAKNGLFGDDCVYSDMGYTTLEEIGTENSNIVTEKQVYFKRIINNSVVNGKNVIIVSIDADGDVNSIISNYLEIDDTIDAEQVITLDDAIFELESLHGSIIADETIQLAVIHNIEIVYWEDSSEKNDINTIQPVYKFTGDAVFEGITIGKFEAYEQAIK